MHPIARARARGALADALRSHLYSWRPCGDRGRELLARPEVRVAATVMLRPWLWWGLCTREALPGAFLATSTHEGPGRYVLRAENDVDVVGYRRDLAAHLASRGLDLSCPAIVQLLRMVGAWPTPRVLSLPSEEGRRGPAGLRCLEATTTVGAAATQRAHVTRVRASRARPTCARNVESGRVCGYWPHGRRP